MKEQHTPGPWRFEESTKTIRNVPGNHWLATIDSWDRAVDHKANARLIAAAPEMLDALQRCKQFLHEVHCRWPEDADYGGSVLIDVDKAIDKATK